MTLEEKIAQILKDKYPISYRDAYCFTEDILDLLRTHYAEQGRELCVKPMEWQLSVHKCKHKDEMADQYNDGIDFAEEYINNQIERV
jgi:hypothetical protein